MTSLRKPVIVITGASRNWSGCHELLLKDFNARVVALSRSQTPELLALASDDLLIVPCDIASESALTDAIARAERMYKQIDGLILNAGILDPLGTIGSDAPISAWKNHFDVNFFSLVTALKAALPALRKSEMGGRVVFVSSGAAVKASTGWGPYSASKAAMNSLCRTMAEEEPSIVSVALRPGMVDTSVSLLKSRVWIAFLSANPDAIHITGQMKNSALADKDHDKFVKAYNEGKLVKPEDAGHVIAAMALRAEHA